MADTARDQVARMLALVPWLHRAADGAPHPEDGSGGEVRVEDAARMLGVSSTQVEEDLRVLFMCGLPGGYPDDLIDVDIDALEAGVIRVSNADYLARPVRLAPAEATALVVALRALADGAEGDTAEVVARTLAKIEAAASDSAASRVHLAADQPARDETVGLLEQAIDAGRQVRISYYVPTRDEQTDRVVDPRALRRDDGAGYLDAWCHRVDAERIFRLDRILSAEILDSPVTHREPSRRDPAAGWLDQADRVRLRLAPPAAWLPEYYPVVARRDLEDGGVEVDLDVADPAWLHQLLLRVAPHAQVVDPPVFAASFTATAREALGLYGAAE